MNKLNLSSLEELLRFPGVLSEELIPDASVLSCGCLTSEAIFRSSGVPFCYNCQKEGVDIISEVRPLRDLYNIIQQLNVQLIGPPQNANYGDRRRSSSKRSGGVFEDSQPAPETMDLISLFYKFAKEEENLAEPLKLQTDHSIVKPIEIKRHSQELRKLHHFQSVNVHVPSTNSISPRQRSAEKASFLNSTPEVMNSLLLESNLLKSLSEEKEYNFSKCFPFHRKLTTFPTQQVKFNLASMTQIPFKSGSMIKKNTRFTGSDIHTYVDLQLDIEVTRFVLINEKRWELYEYTVPLNDSSAESRPQMICCGKLSGEYGENMNELNPANNDTTVTGEIIIKNEFNHNNSDQVASSQESDIKKKLQLWDFLFCQLSSDYLVISGTKGIMRVINLKRNLSYGLGQPIYTYITNFPIRCISMAPNNSLVACGITARERLSGKEQPFVILHRLILGQNQKLASVDPITITIPYRDPIKLINFNPSSTHLVCCTVWESRYLVIKLRSNELSDNYRRPRLIWSDLSIKSQRRHSELEGVAAADAQDQLMMGHEGITDLQFGSRYSNTVIITSCSLKSRPPLVIRLDGPLIDSNRTQSVAVSDTYSIQNSMNSVEEEDFSSVNSAEVILKLSEVGSSAHRTALSPRGDGIVFVNKDGSIYLVSTPNLNSSALTSTNKRVVVLLGEVANAERFTEAASIKFSADGSKIFTVDRKGTFSVFDFTKGVPGEDVDVVKCKLINV
ncbi:uncharacterized protein CANTADRAFT_55534 [Suhomyces tanzawaensis NRRL Y-17324]|uniref:SPS-sensor component PTR3 n=1 Tax=Suhomyces tanzawaensis NRRL Y-17324 TaxID=984487 RepID=A0A1E4SD40_9ASCO|nr:uncharacterized protein CANTADRAFT_55534 [Suhomyces tanzawaensis NRRL Y-17324]ODV77386.1 hypothetical protein CANTADRAFT_55534 [Suhomyces tanzawaensis NRRL Y-17324]